MSQVLCWMLVNGDSKDTRVPILGEFRTSWEAKTKVKKKCDSAKCYKCTTISDSWRNIPKEVT